MIFRRILILATVVLLSGCANFWRVQTDVQSFTTGTPVSVPVVFRFERLPSQQADAAGQAALEAIALPALARAGLVLDAASTSYSLQISTQALEAVLWDEMYGGNGPWMGNRFGPRWPFQPRLFYEPPRAYQRQISLLLRDLRTGQTVYESRASYDSRTPISNALLPVLFDAALQGFPNPPQGLRTVTVDIPIDTYGALMEATLIIAIRHGETAWNVGSRIQGQLDIPLNTTGRWQARRMAQALTGEPITTVYASDLLRALETAQALADALDLPVHTDTGLRERGFGVFQGHTFAEIEASQPEQALRWRKRDPEFAPAGGECLNDFRDRVVGCVSALAAHHPGELIAVVAHGGVMDVLYRAATHQGLQAPRSWDLGNAAINRLLWTPQGFTLVGWADSQHLEPNESLDESST